MKTCGCRIGGLTRSVSVWNCSCGNVQRASRRSCVGCGEKRKANPFGFGCCDQDWPEAAISCGDCGKTPSVISNLPHPEVDYLTEETCRGSVTDRRGIRRCVGCLAKETEDDSA